MLLLLLLRWLLTAWPLLPAPLHSRTKMAIPSLIMTEKGKKTAQHSPNIELHCILKFFAEIVLIITDKILIIILVTENFE